MSICFVSRSSRKRFASSARTDVLSSHARAAVSRLFQTDVLAHKLFALAADLVVAVGEPIEKMLAVAAADEHAMNDLEISDRSGIDVEDRDRLWSPERNEIQTV